MPNKYRIWHSTETFADFILDHTALKGRASKKKLYASDASNPKEFHTIPDHIKKILYLDSPDIIVESVSARGFEPIFTIEVSQEAGTGHNAFQRFARIAASVENAVPALYVYPDGAIVSRKGSADRWDRINPLIFQAMTRVMDIYNIPALLYYFPTDLEQHPCAQDSPNRLTKGLLLDTDPRYLGCPRAEHKEMKELFQTIDLIISEVEKASLAALLSLRGKPAISARVRFMNAEYERRREGREIREMSPASAVMLLPTEKVIRFIERCGTKQNKVGELIRSRPQTAIYQVNAEFRGDPYPGALAALDYLLCRDGRTFENREMNLVMAWGKVRETATTIDIAQSKCSVTDFCDAVSSCEDKNILTKAYCELRPGDIPRYFMQVRYGSTYSKVKHIRVYSYFADAILFHDGCLWRDA
jgi:hypothetical protein